MTRGSSAAQDEGAAEADSLRQRLLVSLALAIPVVVLAMVTALQFRDWQWASLALASPVAVWGAWPFHRAAVINARHGAATMDTLVSLGVAAAYLWSLYALFLGTAGQPGTRMGFAWLADGSGADATYLEVAAGVTALVLLGRCEGGRQRAVPRAGGPEGEELARRFFQAAAGGRATDPGPSTSVAARWDSRLFSQRVRGRSGAAPPCGRAPDAPPLSRHAGSRRCPRKLISVC